MGRQAEAHVDYAGRSGRVAVLLESDGLVLRKPVAAKLGRDTLRDLSVEGDSLIGQSSEGPFRIELGAAKAESWLQAMTTAPPSLADKIGVKAGVTIWTWGPVDDPALAEALRGAAYAGPDAAALRIVVAKSAIDLASAVTEAPDARSPVWVVYGKGRTAAFGESAVRTWMLATGWVDIKVTAVSAALSALKFKRRP